MYPSMFSHNASENPYRQIDLVSGTRLRTSGAGWRVALQSQHGAAVKLAPAPRFIGAAVDTNGAVRLTLEAVLGSVQVLEASPNLIDWTPSASKRSRHNRLTGATR